jgi:CRP-like cAMP-binding protein
MSIAEEDLRSVAFLAPLSAKDRARLAGEMRERSLADGEPAVEQGSTGVAFFVVLEGELSVLIDGTEVRRLHPGDHFGEVSLIVPETPRTATVRALTPARLAGMSQWNFQGFVREHPEVHWPLLLTLATQLSSR